MAKRRWLLHNSNEVLFIKPLLIRSAFAEVISDVTRCPKDIRLQETSRFQFWQSCHMPWLRLSGPPHFRSAQEQEPSSPKRKIKPINMQWGWMRSIPAAEEPARQSSTTVSGHFANDTAHEGCWWDLLHILVENFRNDPAEQSLSSRTNLCKSVPMRWLKYQPLDAEHSDTILGWPIRQRTVQWLEYRGKTWKSTENPVPCPWTFFRRIRERNRTVRSKSLLNWMHGLYGGITSVDGLECIMMELVLLNCAKCRT